ncbi:MAG TPA: ParB/RepB/Spo0J family partition protein [Spirillospora sp.]|nr:ParB/RepB/Spo0J family partition protein [Spirillospora sp.]
MSRGRRRTRDGTGALSSIEQTADAIYSTGLPAELAEIDSRRRPAKPVSIFEVYPDRTQPRRAVPSLVRQHWDGNPATTQTLFEGWLYEIEQAGRRDFDLLRYIEQAHLPENIDGNDDEDDSVLLLSGGYTALERSLLEIADLAISIQQIGLTNPITVARDGRIYRLETGERRWLAYHLLNLYFPDDDWAKIPAYVVDQVNVWRQASENNARADLNAIGKARQLAILLMDLLADEGYEFRTFEEILAAGLSEREYYAQVADGNVYRVPRGAGERLLTAMGLKNPTQIRQYRTLLRLPDHLWQEADDQNWTEFEIRKRYTVTAVTVSREKASERAPNPFVEKTNHRRRKRVWEYANRLDNLSDAERKQAVDEIEADARWLDQLKQAILRRDT